jgi:hypothetical protein
VQKSEKNSFGLLELKITDLEHFLRKTPLGPLGARLLGEHEQKVSKS